MSDTISGLDGIEITDVGTISGRRVGEGGAANSVGTLMHGRSASEANLRQCRKLWPEARAEDFGALPDRDSVFDRATGLVFEVMRADPMFAEDSREACDTFFVANGTIVFLRRVGDLTVDDLERAKVEQQRRAEQAAEQGRRFRERQPKQPIMLADAYPGDRYQVTLAEAARRILDAGGSIERGEHGELRVLVPALLAGEPMLEKDARQPLIAAAEVLVTAHRVVLAEIDKADSERAARKTRLDERLPDKPVTLGGGV